MNEAAERSTNNSNMISSDVIEEEKRQLREEFEQQISEIKSQYEEEKMSKEALQKKMDSIKADYDSQLVLLNTETQPLTTLPPKSGKDRKSGRGKKKKINFTDIKIKINQIMLTLGRKAMAAKQQHTNGEANVELPDVAQESESADPAERLLKLQEMVVGGEQANNEELKKDRIKKKKYAEERKQLLADSLRKGDDEEFMLRVYDR